MSQYNIATQSSSTTNISKLGKPYNAKSSKKLQQALDQFWGFVATQNIAAINHSQYHSEIAISIPEVYALAAEGTLPPTHLMYKALRLSNQPRFSRANVVMQSALVNRSRRVWVFIKSFNQQAIAHI